MGRLPIPATTSTVLGLGDITVHPSDRRVTVRGQAVRLTPKEFDVLFYLARNPNVTVAHTNLLQAV
jgi:DNA-binding response OmpR family regulator